LLYSDPNLINLDKVCRKKKRFNSKPVKLEPSFRRMYDSPTESEEDSDLESDDSYSESDYEPSHQDLVKAMKQYLEAGKAILTRKNYKNVRKNSYK
jgi:hypothetical protein